ncbi:MAG: vWA domain-containing protein [Desulfosudaceae bacterium]
MGQVLFPGMSLADDAALLIDPAPARNTDYPLDHYIIDLMAGQVVHEAYHRKEWSRRVWKILEPFMATLSGRETVRFQKLVHTAETIYVDLAAAGSIAGRYADKAREQAIQEEWRLEGRPGTLEFLLLVWMQTLGPPADSPLPAPTGLSADLLQELRALEESLCTIAATAGPGLVERCRQRADLYQRQWTASAGRLMALPVQNKRLLYFPQQPASSPSGRYATGKDPSPLPASLVQELEVQLSGGSLDLTPMIRAVAGFDNPEVVRMSRWDYHQPCRPVIERPLVSRLRSVFLNYGPRRKITSRGLTTGKIDPRRLYRAPLTGRCFRQQYFVPEERWQICLLVDASGSMQGHKMRIVENTMANLNQALRGGRNRLSAYAYFEINNICMFSSLLVNGRLLTVPPAGKTASGQAIIAAAWMMERGRGRQRNLLIHITDGESNFGCDVQYGLDYCCRENIHLVTLGCGCRDREKMRQQYGQTIQFLKGYEHLPQALERLFKRLFLAADPAAALRCQGSP